MVLGKGFVAFMSSMLLVCVIGNLFLIENCPAAGNTLYVGGIGPGNYTKIQDAINSASSGDIIFVFSGAYYEKLDIAKDVTIIGENKDSTFIDGGSNGHVINAHGIAGSEIQVSLQNLTIRNAGGSGFDCVTFSYVINSEISNNKILNSQEGEGISIDHCSAITIQANTIINNKITGISLTASEQNIIENNFIQNNQKGIHLASFSANNQLISNTIRDNTVYGVYIIQSSSNSFSGNDFTANNQNAQDASTNLWSVDNQGNYWDDYNNYDNNSDGIGDVPYIIPGGTNVDNYPLGYFKQPEPPGGGNQPPVAAFMSISKNQALQNESITFTGEGTDIDGYIVGYQWRSSLDDTLSNQQTFSTTTLSIGTHTIYFKVIDNEGTWSTEKTGTIIINVKINQAPIAYIDEITPNPALQGEPIVFRGHGSDEEGVITEYKWISNKDGVIGMTASFIRANLSRGVHIIYFQVKDTTTWSPQVTRNITIERNTSSGNPENQAPHAYLGGPYTGKVNEVIIFNGSLSYDEEGSIAGYWTFGDGISGTGLTTSHMYTAPGTYTVILSVTDEDEVSSVATTTATITQTVSQGDSLGGFSFFDFEIPFPLLMGLMILLIVGIIIGFIFKIKQR